MKKVYKTIIYSVFLAIALLAAKCKKDCNDPTDFNCPNYNPCLTQTQPSAWFHIEEGVIDDYLNKKVYFSDSVMKGYSIRFRSELEDSKYKHTWHVGNEVFNGHTTPERRFDKVVRPAYMSITHIIEYEPNLSCFLEDDGADTVTRTFRLIASYDELKTYGTYRGVLDNALDSFEVEINSLDFDENPATFDTHWQNKISNFHNLGDTIYTARSGSLRYVNIFGFNHDGIITGSTRGSIKVSGFGIFEMRYKLEYWIAQDSAWHTFKGRKLN